MIKKIFFVIILLILFYDLYETLNIGNYFYKTNKNIFKINNYKSDIISENSDKLSDDLSENSDGLSDKLSDDLSDDLSDKLSDDLSDNLSDDLSDSLSDGLSENSDDLSENSDRLSENSDRLSENDENTKYISKIKQNNQNIKEIININKNNKVNSDEIIVQQQEIIKYQQNIINQVQPENSLDFTNNNSVFINNNNHDFVNNNSVFINNNNQDFVNNNSVFINNNQDFVNNNQDFVNNIIIKHPNQKLKEEKQQIYHEEVDINKYGKPYDYKQNNFIHWDFYDPKPWTKIIYKYGSNDPYNFYIKAKIPSLNDYENWKNYLTNINFDPRSGEIIISCQDEETALSIANLVVSNFKGDIKFDEIINKDLVGISIIKCKKYEVVKNKIKEQLIQNMIVKATNFNDLNKQIENKEKQIIAKNNEQQSNNYFYYNDFVKKNSDFDAYDGNEYSFI